MKGERKTIIICGVISFLMVYLMSFADQDLTQFKTLLEYVFCGAIATVFVKMLWTMLLEEFASDDQDEE